MSMFRLFEMLLSPASFGYLGAAPTEQTLPPEQLHDLADVGTLICSQEDVGLLAAYVRVHEEAR